MFNIGHILCRFNTQATLNEGISNVKSLKDESISAETNQECPVMAWNEWDPLEEVIVGIPDGAIVPKFTREVQVSIVEWLRSNLMCANPKVSTSAWSINGEFMFCRVKLPQIVSMAIFGVLMS